MPDAPEPSNPTSQPATEPRCDLLVMCVRCDQGVEAPLPIDRGSLALLLATHGWFPSVLTPPGQGPEVPIVLAALCPTCARQAFPPEVLKAAEEHRQHLLRSARQAAQGAAR